MLAPAGFFMKFQGPQALPNRPGGPPHSVCRERGGGGQPLLRFHPVAASDDGRGFVAPASGQALFLAEACPPEDGAEETAGDGGNQSELLRSEEHTSELQ